jgi:hypothetical protein
MWAYEVEAGGFGGGGGWIFGMGLLDVIGLLTLSLKGAMFGYQLDWAALINDYISMFPRETVET